MKKQKYVKPMLEVYEVNRQIPLLVDSKKITNLTATRKNDAYETITDDPWEEDEVE